MRLVTRTHVRPASGRSGLECPEMPGFQFQLECESTLPRFSDATKAAGRLNARQCDHPRSRPSLPSLLRVCINFVPGQRPRFHAGICTRRRCRRPAIRWPDADSRHASGPISIKGARRERRVPVGSAPAAVTMGRPAVAIKAAKRGTRGRPPRQLRRS